MIDIQNVSKNFTGQEILKDISLKVNIGEHLGIVGPNGTGKTTLFALITKKIIPDKGIINVPDGLRIAYLKQELEAVSSELKLLEYTENAIPELSTVEKEIRKIENELSTVEEYNKDGKLKHLGILQEKFEALGGYTLRNKAEAALTGLGFKIEEFEKPFAQFSGGWQMRAGLAKVLISDADILLLDEPSNYLDVNSIEWLYRFLKNFNGTMLLISHDRFLLNKLTKITVELNNARITRYEGNFDYYAKERKLRASIAEARKQNQQKKREQLEKFIERFRYKSSKASQVQSRIKMLEKMEDIKSLETIAYSGVLRLPVPPKSSHEVIRLENCSFSYDGRSWIFKDVNINMNKGDKIAIVGYNGMGKTTLLKILAGALSPAEGKRVVSNSTVIGYQAQEFGEILSPENTVYDTLNSVTKDKSNLRSILGSFGFSDDSINKPCKVLSGGEKIRLLFARIFSNPPNLLILDEPTTHLDIRARESLQNILKDYEGTVCFVSHDIEFLRNTAKTIISVENGEIKKYFGDYDYFLMKKEDNVKKIDANNSEEKGNSRRNKRKQNAEIRNRFYKDRKKLEADIGKIEKILEQLEKEKSELVALIDSSGKNINYEEVNRKYKTIEKTLKRETQSWEIKSIELENLEEKIDKLTQ